jgi:hypothetical protein
MIRPRGIIGAGRLCLLLAAAPLVTLLAAGCASLPELPWAPAARDAKAGFYETARLQYRVDAGRLGQPLSVTSVSGGRVGFEQIASSPLADQSLGTLVIQQPHPAGRQGLARVTFSIDSSQSAADGGKKSAFKSGEAVPPIGHQEEVHEVWAMDIPSVEADRYFQVLSTQNFYAGKTVENAPAELAVLIDGKEIRKGWQQIEDLNALAQRVRRDGQLVAYVRPQALSGNTSTAIASVQAYRDLLAKTGPAASAQPAGSVLAAPPLTAQAKMPYAIK